MFYWSKQILCQKQTVETRGLAAVVNIEKVFGETVDDLADFLYFLNLYNTKLVNFTETLGILMVGLFIRLEDEYRK